MLNSPACSLPTVTVVGFLASISSVWNVWNACSTCMAQSMGLMQLWGEPPWPPLPWIVSLKYQLEAIRAPGTMPIQPSFV